MPERDPLDLLIDSALGTYAEPPAGLEDRVLGACAGAPFKPPAKPLAFPVRRLIPWVVALGAAACVLLVLWVHTPQASHRSQERASSALPTPAPLPPVIVTQLQRHSTRPTLSRVHPRQMLAVAQPTPPPKLDVFPTPEPLTPQERALVTFVGQAPEIERRAISQPPQQTEAPLNIAAIYIPPLTPPDKDQ